MRNSNPLPEAFKAVIPPAITASQPAASPLPSEDVPTVSPSSLDNQESCVRNFLCSGPDNDVAPWEASLKLQIGPPSFAGRFRHSGWWRQRERIKESLFRTRQSDSRIRNFCTCGNASWVQKANDDQNRVRIISNHCHDRLCTPCAAGRSMRIREALLRQIGGEPVTFITLTLHGGKESLAELLDRLYRSFRALRLMPIWADAVAGGAAFLEIKWNEKRERWHPHLHIIAESKYMEQGHLTAAWRAITKDSFIVDIRKVRNESVVAGYVTKYVTKPLNTSFDRDPARLDEAVEALKGRRLCMCFGDWFGTPLSLAEDEELADDLTDAHGWSNFLPLDTVIEGANAGDREMTALLIAAGVEARWRALLTADTS